MDKYDLLLNSRGDISFEVAPKEELEQFVFNFHYATSDSLLFNFFTSSGMFTLSSTPYFDKSIFIPFQIIKYITFIL